MSKLFYGSICLTDLIEEAKKGCPSMKKGKNGKVYVSINVWLNDVKDQYGNDAGIKIAQKDDYKGTYIGNLKEGEIKEAPTLTAQEGEAMFAEFEDLPF